MSAPVYDRIFSQDITQKVETRHGGGLVFNGNNGSMTLGVRLYKDGEPLAPSGAVTGQVIRADGQTALTEAGTIEGNLVSVTLNQSCFAVEGPIVASISVTDGGVKTTVLRAAFTVALTSSGPVIDPGQVVPDVEDIVAQYGEMQRVTAEAQAAAGTALSAAAGIGDAQVATFKAQGAATSGAGEDGHTFTLSSDGVSPTSGTNSSGVDLCRLGYTGIGTPLLLTVDTTEYQWCVWIYTGKSVSSKIRSLTNNDYTTGPVIIPNTEGAKYFRIGFKRLDGATVTEEMRSALAAQMHIYALTDTTLTTSGAAADAKAVGDRITTAETAITSLGARATALENFQSAQTAYDKRDRMRLIQWKKNASPNATGPVSSMTVIGDKLFVFKATEDNEDVNDNKAYPIGADGQIDWGGGVTFTSNIGHANTVNWNPLNGCLLTARTPTTHDTNDGKRTIIIFPDVTSETTAFDRRANGVTNIDLDLTITVGSERAFGDYRLNAVWGPNTVLETPAGGFGAARSTLIYVVSDDSSSNASGKRRLALLQLATGANTTGFSYGTAVAADEGAFNGMYNVLQVWTHEWTAINGLAEGDNDMTYYGGTIYEIPAPVPTAGFPLMLHTFDDFGLTWKTERILIPVRGLSGTATAWERGGIAIYNGHMYVGTKSAGLFTFEF